MRADTRDVHASLDSRLSVLDLTSTDGLAGFLALQAAALPRMAVAAGTARTAGMRDDLAECARCDLRLLGVSERETATGPAVPVHALAMDYVILGSRLGTAVLRRHWAASRDARVRQARHYFEAPARPDLWREFCRETGEMTATGAEADRVVADVRDLFALYDDCAEGVLGKGQTTNEFT